MAAKTGFLEEFSAQDYPEPEAGLGIPAAKDYPVAALPDIIKHAVIEVQDYSQAPMGLVACNALAALSLVAQALARVRRDHRLSSPVSLFFMAVLESGGRKSFAESFFINTVKRWEAKQIAKLKEPLAQYEADQSMWAAQVKGLKALAERHTRNDETESLAKVNEDLARLMGSKPKAPIVPRLLAQDITHQALIQRLQKFGFMGIFTAEGGTLLGGAGFSGDVIMGALSILCDLYSGNDILLDRKSEAPTKLDGSRLALSMNIAIQPEVLLKFIKRTNGLAYGSGFLPRQLFCMPDVNAGERFYKEAPESMPGLDQFQERLTELLGLLAASLQDEDFPKRKMLDLNPDAKKVWIDLYNRTEAAQGFGGELEFMRAEGGRAAENAARLAALFHVFDSGLDGDISADHMSRACQIIAWHLHEARRFSALYIQPETFTFAADISQRIAGFCRKHQTFRITRRDVLRYCTPDGVADIKTLNPVIDELLAANHLLDRANEKRSQILTVNPRIFDLYPTRSNQA